MSEQEQEPAGSESSRAFGKHVRSLRRARGLTQEHLATRAGLAADTVRRLEHGTFSPSLTTMVKLCEGLALRLSTLFESFELAAENESRELLDLVALREPQEIRLALAVLRAMFAEIDAREDEEL